tara:strand:- start:1838 stop:2203 length:366 start_codon:yes stop_codon:yes gene_type:complete
MRNLLTLLTIILLLPICNAQNTSKDTLQLSDAVLGYYKGLYPENLNGLNWNEINELYIQEKNDLIIFNSANNWSAKKHSISTKIIKDKSVSNLNLLDILVKTPIPILWVKTLFTKTIKKIL